MSIKVSDYLTKEDCDQIVRDALRVVEPRADVAQTLFALYDKLPTEEVIATAFMRGYKKGKEEK